MTTEQFGSDLLTNPQRTTMCQLQERSGIPWDTFLAEARPPALPIFPYVSILNFNGMFVGIEPDGEPHT